MAPSKTVVLYNQWLSWPMLVFSGVESGSTEKDVSEYFDPFSCPSETKVSYESMFKLKSFGRAPPNKV